jgi:hypothetical protein
VRRGAARRARLPGAGSVRLTRPGATRRSVQSPTKLMTTYEAPDDNIHTLYDNLETSISRYPHVSSRPGGCPRVA